MHPAVWPQYKWAQNWGRGLRPLLWRGLGPYVTQSCLGWGLPPCQVPSWSIQPFGHNKYEPKIWGLCPLFGEVAGSPSNIKSPRLRPASMLTTIYIIQPFGHNKHGPKIWGAPPPFGEGDAGSPSNTKSPGLSPTSIPSGILIPAAICHNRYGPKIGGGARPPLGEGELGPSPSNTMWPGRRPTCMPSFILIRPTVWPQYTNITDWTGQTAVW